MKLNKTLETTILEAYHEYWDAYLKGDMQTMSYWLHDNIQMIGSGRGSFLTTKKRRSNIINLRQSKWRVKRI